MFPSTIFINLVCVVLILISSTTSDVVYCQSGNNSSSNSTLLINSTSTTTTTTTATTGTTSTTTILPIIESATTGVDVITYFELAYAADSPFIQQYFLTSNSTPFRNVVRNLLQQKITSVSFSKDEIEQITPKIFSTSSSSSGNVFSVVFFFASVWTDSPWDQKSLRAASALKNYLQSTLNAGLVTAESTNVVAEFLSASLFGEKLLNPSLTYFPGASLQLSRNEVGNSLEDFSIDFNAPTQRETGLDEEEIVGIIVGVCGGLAMLVFVIAIFFICFCKSRFKVENKKNDPFGLRSEKNATSGEEEKEQDEGAKGENEERQIQREQPYQFRNLRNRNLANENHQQQRSLSNRHHYSPSANTSPFRSQLQQQQQPTRRNPLEQNNFSRMKSSSASQRSNRNDFEDL
jgi:hypothetical protein